MSELEKALRDIISVAQDANATCRLAQIRKIAEEALRFFANREAPGEKR